MFQMFHELPFGPGACTIKNYGLIDFIKGQCLFYYQSLSQSWTNTLDYYIISQLLIRNVLQYKPQVVLRLMRFSLFC
jgi:hypothetical protein